MLASSIFYFILSTTILQKGGSQVFRQKIACAGKHKVLHQGRFGATGAAERMKNDPRTVLVTNPRFEGSSDAIALRSVSCHCNASF